MIKLITTINEEEVEEGQNRVMRIFTNVITPETGFTGNELAHAGRILGVLSELNEKFQLEFDMTKMITEQTTNLLSKEDLEELGEHEE